ncbi:hypothetical protein [Parasphingorhabdus halotolerans]|uniref:Uncharacterized protein n=1 Tax=Parasphingorhabdus halotolerans TaxID=2725558 RepID=A0A6H2DMM0_9SPHN|nr:hypothetical protein [Parasphingorhabdus halotolerans]QJB69001.1 hypothetical protein HF685_06655 [Parasphingorhabdus halotolerans]
MVDGNCSEYSNMLVEYPDGVTAYKFEDAGSVWLCFKLPEGSYPSGELILSTPELEQPLVIHFSAQLGEWQLGDKDAEPKVATSDKWWNNKDWIGTVSRFNGMEEFEGEPSPRFLKADAQELQFSKSRFGAGEWRLSGALWAVNSKESGLKRLNISPEGQEYLTFMVTK